MNETPPIIEALKKYGSLSMITDCYSLPTASPYGNLNLTYQAIVTRVDCLNELIIQLYTGFDNHKALIKTRGGWSHLHESHQHKFEIEEVIYWLRKTTDELISFTYILDSLKKIGEYPEQIMISNLGTLLQSQNENFRKEYFNGYDNLFKKLNEISNAYKHTFINAQLHAHTGEFEPVVFALSAFNVSSDTPKYHQIGLRALLEAFNNFLLTVLNNFDNVFNLKKQSLPGNKS